MSINSSPAVGWLHSSEGIKSTGSAAEPQITVVYLEEVKFSMLRRFNSFYKKITHFYFGFCLKTLFLFIAKCVDAPLMA